MALSKTITTDSGVDVQYHRIADITLFKDTETAMITVYSYISEDTRRGGYAPYEREQYTFSGLDYPFTVDGATFTDAYNAIKSIDKYKDAEDC